MRHVSKEVVAVAFTGPKVKAVFLRFSAFLA